MNLIRKRSNKFLSKDSIYNNHSIEPIDKQSKDHIVKNEKNHHSAMRKLLKLIRAAFFQMEIKNLRVNTTELIVIEWKEIARRVDYIMLFISLFSVITTPVLLFGEFFIRDIVTKSHLSDPCGCDYSFVRSV